MSKQTIYNAGIYVRLSQEDMRAGESLSIENQKLILTKYVSEQGWNLENIYVDDGYSGTDFDRPGVTRLLEDAKTGKINLIICKDLSRFGRNYIQVGHRGCRCRNRSYLHCIGCTGCNSPEGYQHREVC